MSICEGWKWIECSKCGFGQRANPDLIKMGAKPFCPDCDVEMSIRDDY